MRQPLDLIVLPFHDWKKNETEGLRNRDGHLVEHFLASPRVGKVLFVDRPISGPERWLLRRPLRCRSGQAVARSGRAILSRLNEKLFVLDQPAPDLLSPLRLRRDWWDVVFRRPAVLAAIGWGAEQAGLSTARRALVCSSPLATGAFGLLGERVIHFDADDNWTRHPQMRDARGWIRRGYETACRRADVLTCNSERLGQFLSGIGGRPIVIRNGVDPDRWDPDRWGRLAPPPELARLSRPWIGYAGRLARRIDVELILGLARRRPEASFVLLGPTLDARWIAPLRRQPNVHLLGDRPYDELPGWVVHFDVAAIWHHVGDLENDGDPTKLYEYLALGLPVVTTPIQGVETFAPWIAIAPDVEAMDGGIGEALARRGANPTAYRSGRQAVIDLGFTWAARAARFLDLLEAAISAQIPDGPGEAERRSG